MSRYDDILDNYRRRGLLLANETLNELYTILREEEKLTPEDARAKVEHDCIDLWSKATIRKFLPPESKNEKKKNAGKTRAEKMKKTEKAIIIEQTTDRSNCAGINPAENASFHREQQESRTFHNELDTELSSRSLSPEFLELYKMLAEKDKKIEELKSLLDQNQNPNYKSNIYISEKIAMQIFEIVSDSISKGLSNSIGLNLEHDGYEVIQIKSLNETDIPTNSNSCPPTLDGE